MGRGVGGAGGGSKNESGDESHVARRRCSRTAERRKCDASFLSGQSTAAMAVESLTAVL